MSKMRIRRTQMMTGIARENKRWMSKWLMVVHTMISKEASWEKKTISTPSSRSWISSSIGSNSLTQVTDNSTLIKTSNSINRIQVIRIDIVIGKQVCNNRGSANSIRICNKPGLINRLKDTHNNNREIPATEAITMGSVAATNRSKPSHLQTWTQEDLNKLSRTKETDKSTRMTQTSSSSWTGCQALATSETWTIWTKCRTWAKWQEVTVNSNHILKDMEL